MMYHENVLDDLLHDSAFPAFAGFTVVIVQAEVLESITYQNYRPVAAV